MGADFSSGLSTDHVAPLTTAARLGAWLEHVLAARQRRDYRRVFLAGAAIVGAFCALVIAHGPCLQLFYGHDDIGFLAAAWKIRHGIFPHADYHSALGALSPWIHAAGMWVLGPTAAVLPICNALVAVALGWVAWAVAARRLPALPAGIFAVTQSTVAMTPHLLRFKWYAATYDGYYNRQGYALVCTLLLLFFLPPVENENERLRRRDEWYAGALLGGLFFLKISYFMVGIGLGGTALILGRRFAPPRPWRALVAFGLTFLLCLPLIRFDLAAMFRDLQMAAGARLGTPAAEFTLAHYLAWLPDAWVEVALLAAAQAALRTPLLFNRVGRTAPEPTWAGFLAVIGASMFLCMTNSPGGSHSETPLLTSWIFVLVGSRLRRAGADEKEPAHPAQWLALPVVCAVAAVLWCYTFGPGFRCLCWIASPWPTDWQQAALAGNPRFESDPLNALPIADSGGEPIPMTYAGKVNDGLRLLRALGGTHRVEALDFVNPFPFALQWPPARGGMWCWHDGYSFSVSSYPAAEEAFGDADVMMVPKFPGENSSFHALRFLYGPYIKVHFRPVAESDQWTVLQRD